MKKVFFAALFSVSLMTANAQEPNIPMFGGRQNIDVKFDEYKAAPQGFNQERAGIAKGTVKLIEYQSESVGTIRKANVYLPPKYDAKKKYSVMVQGRRCAEHHHGQPLRRWEGSRHDCRHA